jgi:hypothetical protein
MHHGHEPFHKEDKCHPGLDCFGQEAISTVEPKQQTNKDQQRHGILPKKIAERFSRQNRQHPQLSKPVIANESIQRSDEPEKFKATHSDDEMMPQVVLILNAIANLIKT